MSFYDAADFFVGQPLRSYGVALVMVLLLIAGAAITRQRKALFHGPTLGVAVAWVIYGVNEYYARESGSNIRVDLLVFWPAIVIGTITGLIFWVKMILKCKPCAPQG